MSSSDLEQLLANNETAAPVPRPSNSLLQQVSSGRPAQPRQPGRDLVMIGAILIGTFVVALLVLGLRRDFSEIGWGYRIIVSLLWAGASCTLAWVAVLPARGSALPRARVSRRWTMIAAAVFVLLGFVWTESGASSLAYDTGVASTLRFAPYCLTIGVGAAAFPIIMGAVLLRRALPTSAGAIGAGIGAAGGCIGGAILLSHCYIAVPSHFGLVHGGAIVIAAGLGALIFRCTGRP